MDLTELGERTTESQESHDVTARDQLLLILAAIIPFAISTLWYLLSH